MSRPHSKHKPILTEQDKISKLIEAMVLGAAHEQQAPLTGVQVRNLYRDAFWRFATPQSIERQRQIAILIEEGRLDERHLKINHGRCAKTGRSFKVFRVA